VEQPITWLSLPLAGLYTSPRGPTGNQEYAHRAKMIAAIRNEHIEQLEGVVPPPPRPSQPPVPRQKVGRQGFSFHRLLRR
jgi:hypothetical protein